MTAKIKPKTKAKTKPPLIPEEPKIAPFKPTFNSPSQNEYTTESFTYIPSWWQLTKETFFPNWLKKYFPVKKETKSYWIRRPTGSGANPEAAKLLFS